jgi:hypothetical protein
MGRIVTQSFQQHETLTVSSTALGLTASKISGMSVAILTAETAQMRFWLDGTEPTATQGHVLEAGDMLVLEGASVLAGFKAIRTTGSDGKLQCSYGVA